MSFLLFVNARYFVRISSHDLLWGYPCPLSLRMCVDLYVLCSGRICLDTLKSPPAGSWSPAVSLPSLLLSIKTLMGEPNPDDGLEPDISDLYKTNVSKWTMEAKRRANKDATVEKCQELEIKLDGNDEQEKPKDKSVAVRVPQDAQEEGGSRKKMKLSFIRYTEHI